MNAKQAGLIVERVQSANLGISLVARMKLAESGENRTCGINPGFRCTPSGLQVAVTRFTDCTLVELKSRIQKIAASRVYLDPALIGMVLELANE